ncbi:MAG: NADH pyrophosphatase [Pseudomonas citronellolis]|nr:MAG: NADH pyrophosphatase [Pseudomonas citronellolis]
MNFCSQCGAPVRLRIPEGDNRPRYVCERCHTVHYQNPRIVAGCLATWEGRVLLCRRAIAPRQGFWTLPAGFMENAETIAEAAARETLEEACARVGNLQLYTVFDLPHISQVYIFFRAELLAEEFAAGEESLEVGLFEESDIPWGELAFPTVGRTLECWFGDRAVHHYPVRNEAIAPMLGHNKKV